jgi:hypothetical protein
VPALMGINEAFARRIVFQLLKAVFDSVPHNYITVSH